MPTLKTTKGLTWPLLLLALATTLVYMAALAALQHSCYSIGFPGGVLAGNSAPNGAFGMSSGYANCRTVFRLYWFIFAFVFATLVGLAITAAWGAGLHFSRAFWVGMLAVSTLLMMVASEAFLGAKYLYEGAATGPGRWLAQLRTTAAGAIMSVAALVLLMMVVGTDWEHRRASRGREGEKPVSGLAPAPAAATAPVVVPRENVRVAEQV